MQKCPMAWKVLVYEFWMAKCKFLLAAGELLESYIVNMQEKKKDFLYQVFYFGILCFS